MRRSLGLVFVLLAILAIVPSTVYAQASIAGTVKDASGAVLPGVTVEAASPALIEKSRTAVTDGGGQYKIEALRPGAYSVTFELAGFSTVKREGVELTGTFTAKIDAEMKVGALTETITVTGETPIVDVQNTKQQYVIGQELMRALPSSGNLQSIASLLPSVIRGTVDVGGLLGESGSSTGSMTTHGNGDVRTEVGGISVHATQGSGTNNLGNGAAYQEMQVDTSGVSAEQKEGGIRMNMVPRDGGNTFQAHFITAFANEQTQGNNITPELTAAGFVAPNSLRKYVEINPSGGGPIMRDKLWFFGTYRYNHAADNAPVLFNLNAGNPNSWTYVPDTSRESASNDNLWKSTNERLTWQATAKNKIGFSYDYASSCPCPRSLTATTSPEANVSNYAPIKPGKMLFLDWTAPVTNRLLFEAGFMKRDSQSSRPLTNIYFTNDPHGILLNGVTEQSSGLVYRASSSVATSSQNPTRQPRLTVSYITGAHSVKAGVNLAFQNNEQKSYSIDSPLSFRFNNGVPNQMTLVATPFETFIHEQDHGAFIQDRWTVNRFTVTGGLRFDYFKVEFPAQGVGPAPLTPNRNFNYPETFGPTWKDLEPRAGLAWDVRGNGKTAIKLSANKYLAFFGAPNASSTFNSINTFTTNMNPLALLVNSTSRSWTDTNKNFVPDCNILNPAAQTVVGGDVCGAMANPAFGTSVQGASYDPATLSGWNKRPDSNWQFSAGVQHQILPRVSVDVSYFRTIFTNAVVQDDLSVAPSDFDTFSITAPLDPRLPGGGGYTVPGLTNLKPASFGRAANNYITFADNFGGTINHWNGLDITFVMRPKFGLMVQGGTSTGRTSTNTCSLNQPIPEFLAVSGGANPAAFCDQKGAWLTQLKVISSYTVPKADVQVSATVQSVPGPNILANFTATNAVVQPSLGRPLSGGAANISVSLIEPGATYGERMNELDLRLTKTLKFAKTRTNIGVDLYNVLNGNAVLTSSPAFATWQRPTKILGPRFARFVATFDF